MRRMILGLAAALLAFTASDASACCHKKACATPCAPVCAPVCEPVCAPVKKCHMPKICLPKFHMPKLGCHKKAVCAPACNTCEVAYAAPQSTWAAPQASYAAPQGLAVPQK
jgi:hypothetical protein